MGGRPGELGMNCGYDARKLGERGDSRDEREPERDRGLAGLGGLICGTFGGSAEGVGVLVVDGVRERELRSLLSLSGFMRKTTAG